MFEQFLTNPRAEQRRDPCYRQAERLLCGESEQRYWTPEFATDAYVRVRRNFAGVELQLFVPEELRAKFWINAEGRCKSAAVERNNYSWKNLYPARLPLAQILNSCCEAQRMLSRAEVKQLAAELPEFGMLKAAQKEQRSIQSSQDFNHTILLRTCDRPERLKRALFSIVDNILAHQRSNAEIVLFDDSKCEAHVRSNSLICERARASVRDTVDILHITPQVQQALRAELAERMSESELATVLPDTRSFSRSANFGALICLALNGTNISRERYNLVHHFDDDLTLDSAQVLYQEGRGKLRISPSRQDFLGCAERSFEPGVILAPHTLGIYDATFHDLSRNVREGVFRELSALSTELELGKIDQAKQRCAKMRAGLKSFKSGRLPLGYTEEHDYVHSLLAYLDAPAYSGASWCGIDLELLKLVPHIPGVTDSDVAHHFWLNELGFNEVSHAGTIFNWYGEHQKPLTFRTYKALQSVEPQFKLSSIGELNDLDLVGKALDNLEALMKKLAYPVPSLVQKALQEYREHHALSADQGYFARAIPEKYDYRGAPPLAPTAATMRAWHTAVRLVSRPDIFAQLNPDHDLSNYG